MDKNIIKVIISFNFTPTSTSQINKWLNRKRMTYGFILNRTN